MFHKTIASLLLGSIVATGCAAPSEEAPAYAKPTTSAVGVLEIADAVGKVWQAVQAAYGIYSGIRDFENGSRGLVADIEAARDRIISEIKRSRQAARSATFETVVSTYGDFVRNPDHPSSRDWFTRWVPTTKQLFFELKGDLKGTAASASKEDLQLAYALAPLFNATGALLVSVMNGVPALGVPAFDQASINDILLTLQDVNYGLIGAQRGTSDSYGPVEPFWGSVFWRSQLFGGEVNTCRLQAGCPDPSAGVDTSTPILCSAIDGCWWSCLLTGPTTDDFSSFCYQENAETVKARYLNDPVITLLRLSLAVVTQTTGAYRIYDPNWGWVVIDEA